MVLTAKMKNHNILGVIHARGGSKRVPLKNIKPLNGIPLIGYIIKASLASGLLDKVIVSTDHEEIMKISRQYGAEVPFVRPADIAEDVSSELVTQHAVEFLENNGENFDIIATLQPTTPFCEAIDIDSCIKILLDHPDLDSAVTAKKIAERPEWMFTFDGKSARLFLEGEYKGERGISQCLPDLYMPNGAVFATRRGALFEKNLIITDKLGMHIMSAEKSIDIDEPIDFKIAEYFATYSEP